MILLKIQIKIIQFLKKIKLIEDRTYNPEIEYAIYHAKKIRKFIPYTYQPRRKQ